MKEPSGPVQTETNNPRHFALAVTALFFVVALVGILKHEMWRDEFHCWLVARDAHSIIQLFKNVRYDGHPIVWYASLYVLTRFTSNPVAMQFFLLGLATAAIYLFNRFSTFTVVQKVLFSFGYYALYEYSIIARSYSLGFFLVILFCCLYKHRQKNTLWLFLVLSLLANTSAFGLALSVCFAGFLFLDWFGSRRNQPSKEVSAKFFVSTFGVFVLSAVFSVIQILPEKDNTLMHPTLGLLRNAGRMKIVLTKISEAYLLIPEIGRLPFWISDQSVYPKRLMATNLYIFLSIAIVVAVTSILARKPRALLLYWTGTIGVVCLLGLTYTLGARHIGHFFILFVSTLWLSDYSAATSLRNSGLTRFAELGNRIRNPFIILVFAVQTIAGLAIYVTDLGNPFSASKEAAHFIVERNLGGLPIVGTPDWATEGFAALLNKQIYYPERSEFGSFIIWDGKRKPKPSNEQIVKAIDTVLGQDQASALLILNYPAAEKVSDSQSWLDLNTVNPTIKLSPLAQFDEAMMFDEIYYLYIAQRVKP